MGLAHRSLVSPCHSFPFPSFSLSALPSGWLLGAQGLSEFTFLPGILRPDREGSLRLHQGGGVLCPHPTERVPAASKNRPSSMPGALLAFCVYQGRSSPALCSAILSPRSSSWGYPWILLGLDPGNLPSKTFLKLMILFGKHCCLLLSSPFEPNILVITGEIRVIALTKDNMDKFNKSSKHECK